MICPFCEGDGFLLFGGWCSECHGSGVLEDDEPGCSLEIKCEDCGQVFLGHELQSKCEECFEDEKYFVKAGENTWIKKPL